MDGDPNILGRFYITEQCTRCVACLTAVPKSRDFLKLNRTQSYVFRQPETPEEIETMLQAYAVCPTSSIKDRERD